MHHCRSSTQKSPQARNRSPSQKGMARVRRINRQMSSKPLSTPKAAYTPPPIDICGKSKIPNQSLRLILLGAPGSGKGSYGKYLSHYYQIPIISTGDLLRQEVKMNTLLGQQVAPMMQRGELIPDDLLVNLTLDHIAQHTDSRGYILDGFPRTLSQAQLLQESTKIAPPNRVFYLHLPHSVIVEKTLARHACGDCGRGYNLAHIDLPEHGIFMPAMNPVHPDGKCDDCEGSLVQRVDDTEETIKHRLAVYETSTAPLVDFYSQKGIVTQWNIKRGFEDVPEMIEALNKVVATAPSV